jgi:hypothetical protein
MVMTTEEISFRFITILLEITDPYGIVYLTILSLLVFGRNEFYCKILPAFLGLYHFSGLFLFKEINGQKKFLLFGVLFSSHLPWHISIS